MASKGIWPDVIGYLKLWYKKAHPSTFTKGIISILSISFCCASTVHSVATLSSSSVAERLPSGGVRTKGIERHIFYCLGFYCLRKAILRRQSEQYYMNI